MINTHGDILEKLTDSEYFLLSILVNYGKKSHPKNDVLLKKTRWGIQKLQAVKKDLISKEFLIVNSRIDKEKGGKGSNEYVVNTKLLSKYKCTNKKCGWEGKQEDKSYVVLQDGYTEDVCPKCTNNEFYGLI